MGKDYFNLKLLSVIIWAIFIFLLLGACSTSTELTKIETETITIQPVKIKPPDIIAKFEAPLIEPRTKEKPEQVFEGTKTIEIIDDNEIETKAEIKTRVIIKEDEKGNPVANIQVEVKQDSIKTKAQVISSKTKIEKKKETESLFGEMKSFLIWFIILIIIVSAGLYFFRNSLLFFKK